jgi:hypothetical protein
MKKVLIPGVALLLGATALNAQSNNEFKYGFNEIKVAPFEKIRINANVQVVLVPNTSVSKVFVEGDQKMLNNIIVSSENGELVINSAHNFPGKHNLLVTIPVDTVKLVAIKGAAKVESIGN